MKTFFSEDDYRAYLTLLASEQTTAGVTVWAYCLMPNHVHLVVVPEREESLAQLFRATHRRYTRRVNLREGWRGHLWQERFHSFVMDERYLHSTVRYTELNPVRARLCATPADWPWSSARAHLAGIDDGIVTVAPMLQRVADWARYLDDTNNCDEARIRRHARTGRPAGDGHFVKKLELLTGRRLEKDKPGPKPREK